MDERLVSTDWVVINVIHSVLDGFDGGVCFAIVMSEMKIGFDFVKSVPPEFFIVMGIYYENV